MENKTPPQQPFTSIDPTFIQQPITEPKVEKPKDPNSVFDTEEGKLSLIRILLSTIGKDLNDIDQEFIDKIFSKDNYVPEIFREYADKNCKKCMGRGFTGWIIHPKFQEKIPQICKCCRREIEV